jgi:hypothetical protein
MPPEHVFRRGGGSPRHGPGGQRDRLARADRPHLLGGVAYNLADLMKAGSGGGSVGYDSVEKVEQRRPVLAAQEQGADAVPVKLAWTWQAVRQRALPRALTSAIFRS